MPKHRLIDNGDLWITHLQASHILMTDWVGVKKLIDDGILVTRINPGGRRLQILASSVQLHADKLRNGELQASA